MTPLYAPAIAYIGKSSTYHTERGRLREYYNLLVRSRVDSNTFTIGPPYALVDLNPMPESTFYPVRDFVFGLCIAWVGGGGVGLRCF